MEREDKIQVLKAIAVGKANVYDLISGDGNFIAVAGYYIKDGVRYTEQEFIKIKESLDKRGIELNGIAWGKKDNQTSLPFILKYTKPSLLKKQVNEPSR